MSTNYQQILEEIFEETQLLRGTGKVADYIPALKQVRPDRYGIAVQTLNGETFQVGDAMVPFSIQSISKVFVLVMAFRKIGEELWQRVGREPSGNAFNSLIQLETENGIPRNPFINAGALVVTDHLLLQSANPLLDVLSFVREISDSPHVNINEAVALSERQSGFRNAALVNLMKSFGNIKNDLDDVLNVYF